jgi:N-acetylmuramoyl-L-alanine amidase
MRRLVGLLILIALLAIAGTAPVDAAGRKIVEKETVLDEAFRIADRLRNAGLDVVLTRTTDRYVELGDRSRAAKGADLFVSVHNNGNKSRALVGTEAYYQIGNRFGGELAADMVRRISAAAGTVARGAFIRRGDNGDYYFVLRETPITAIIVEGAFLSNPGEAKRLSDPGFRRAIADGVADAIIARLTAPVAQGAGPPAPRATPLGALLPSPVHLAAAFIGNRAVKVSWASGGLASYYDVWRDGNYLGSTTATELVDKDLTKGRHRYEVRAVLDVLGAAVQDSNSAVVDALVPMRVVLDPGHGGKDAGAIGTY